MPATHSTSVLDSLLAANPLVRVTLLAHHLGSTPYVGSRSERTYVLCSELLEATDETASPVESWSIAIVELALASCLAAYGVSSFSTEARAHGFDDAPRVFDALVRLHGIQRDESDALEHLRLAAQALNGAMKSKSDPLACPANDDVFSLKQQGALAGLSAEATFKISARAERAILTRTSAAFEGTETPRL